MVPKVLERPSWSRTFIEEPQQDTHKPDETKPIALFRPLTLCAFAVVGLCLQTGLLLTTVQKLWIALPATAWAVAIGYTLLLRPRTFSLILLALFMALFASQCSLLVKTWQDTFHLEQRLMLGTTIVALLAVIMTVIMPMRKPTRSTFGISKPFSAPTNDLRSPEDNLTFWQWMTFSWVSPLLKLAKKRQLDEEDVWKLPYEYQHTYLHNAFRQLKGSVLRRLLVANWFDLVFLTLLELLELVTNYSQPLLLQQLLKAMQHLDIEKRPALTYAFLILFVRVVNAQSEVFSLWYGRRCYERSRGEMITMLYEKTLHRKIVAQTKAEDDEDGAALDRVNTAQSTDENTPLLASKAEKKSTWSQRALTQLKVVWQSVRLGLKGVDVKKQQPAEMGKIMNLMRYDAYEVAQRFWDFQKLVEKPIGLLLSLGLAYRLLGWPALLAVAVIVVGQILNYLLALVDVRFEKVRRSATDKRLQQTSQYIESIRHLRWYGWQIHWLDNVFKARQKELNLRLVAYIWTEIIIFNNTFSSGLITVSAFWAYTVLAKRQLSVDIVFPALEIFNLVQDNMGDIPELIQTLLNANVALKRIQAFMDEPDKQQSANVEMVPEGHVEFRNASFAWPGLRSNVLHDLTLTFGPGLTMVTGEVASGKSALLQAILGELDISGGELLKPQSPVAYCAQTPWLQSMTIRDNILFNSAYEPERYRKALQVCALIHDLATFEKGDLSPIGENGIGLSGGQKARVALARAIYSHASILLLDDPLSALDQQTSEYIVSECFQGELVKGRTVILVTHRTDLCAPIANQIISTTDGRAEPQQHISAEHTPSNGNAGDGVPNPNLQRMDTKEMEEAIPTKFEEEEKRQRGEIKARIYWEYLKAGNLILWGIAVITMILMRVVIVGVTWYLKEFSEAYQRQPESLTLFAFHEYAFIISETRIPLLRKLFDSLPSPVVNVMPWLVGLLLLYVAQATMLVLAMGVMMVTRYCAGRTLFKAVMHRVSNTNFRYYDVTPVGRLMNRLTSDMGTVDGGIGWDLFGMMWASITWIVSITVVASVTPLFLAVSILLTIVFVRVFFQFLPASQSLRRLESVSLSPLMTNFGALLSGLTTVRSFRAEDRFQEKLIKVVDTFQGMDHFYWSVQGWLTYRYEVMSATSTLILTVIAIYTNLSAGLTAFVLVSAQKFVSTTHNLCRVYGRLQVNFVSVERVIELLDLEQEPTNPVPPPAWWPSYGGNVVFENVTIRYAPHLEPALTDVSFELKGGTNTAIVGRTGSGKSTLAAALLATVPVEKGRILIDGIDLATVDRQALRTRITFLAQEPVLFEGSLRHNLDPTKEHSDNNCKNVIERVAGKFGWTLATQVEAGGRNLSQGQRQLVGLARAILRRSSVIIMDEATASIDVETAWEIQRVLREELKNSTVVTIAHRTAAVRDADNAIVLANGRLESFGPAAGGSEINGEDIHA
ncbi:hypothetical protein OHC33_008010 [Knufia fluminis]|uniref:Uncharacterized protein n=1 Tax=Knufia fluminis TaxID=191047 RepID=A0AAN8ES14_9EURO|nr:hypothetical protein OHC33_008010 [Knufia fluminis]